MSLVIQTIDGKTSVGYYPLKKYTRIGAAENSNLVILEEGVPEDVCIVEKKGEDSVKIHCKSSNTTRLAGKLLHRGTVVEWKLNETLDICGGAVKLRLTEQNSPSRSGTERREVIVSRSRRDDFSQPPVTSMRRQSIGPSMVSGVDASYYAYDDLEGAKKKQTKLAVQLLVVFLCVAVCGAMVFLNSRKKEEQTNNLQYVAYYILGGDKVVDTKLLGENDRSWFSFNRGDLAELFQIAYLQEYTNPSMALFCYQTLQDRLTLAYQDKRAENVPVGRYYDQLYEDERAAVDDKTSYERAAYYKASDIIQWRINYLSWLLSR